MFLIDNNFYLLYIEIIIMFYFFIPQVKSIFEAYSENKCTAWSDRIVVMEHWALQTEAWMNLNGDY